MEPIRCFTCNAVLRFAEYERRVVDEPPVQIFTSLGIRRFCCRRMYLSHPIELEEHLRSFPLRDATRNDYTVRFEAEAECVVRTD